MMDRQPLEGERRRRMVADEGVERRAARDGSGDRLDPAEIRDDDDLSGARELLRNGRELRRHLDRLAVVPIAVAGEEQPRFDLAEAVEHAALAEIRRAGGPD